MSLLDDLASPPAANTTCAVATLMGTLTEAESSLLRAALEPDTGRDPDDLRKILHRNGHTSVTGDALKAHKAAVALARGRTRKTLPCSCTGL